MKFLRLWQLLREPTVRFASSPISLHNAGYITTSPISASNALYGFSSSFSPFCSHYTQNPRKSQSTLRGQIFINYYPKKQGWGIGAVLLFDIALIQLRITLRHAQIGMRHQMLQAKHISAVFQKERCETVPQLIGCDFNPALLTVFQKGFIQMVYLQLFAFIVGKKPIVLRLRLDFLKVCNQANRCRT